MNRILVTGATGFLGQHLCRHLLGLGYRVRAHGRNAAVLRDLASDGAEPVFGSFDEEGWALRASEGCRAVVHAGGLSSPWGTRRAFEAANVASTASMVEACERYSARLVFISTPSLYVDSRDRFGIRETDPLPARLINEYARSKRRAEALVTQAGERGLETVILRPQAIFGPGDTSLLPRFVTASRTLGIPELRPDGPLVEPTCVDNVCHAIALALAVGPSGLGRVFHLSNGEPIRLIPFLREVFDRLDLPFRSRPRSAHLLRAAASFSEAWHRIVPTRKEPLLTRYAFAVLCYDRTLDLTEATHGLGYRPQVSLDEGVTRLVAGKR